MKRSTAAIIWQKDRILIAKRKKDDLWEFPGGKIDAGETPKECLVREIKEELDIDIHIISLLTKIVGQFRHKDMELYAYFAFWMSGEIKCSVHHTIEWIEPKELKKYSFIREDQEIVKCLLSLTKKKALIIS